MLPLRLPYSDPPDHSALATPHRNGIFTRSAWLSLAILFTLAAFPACATSNVGTTATSSGSGTTAGGSEVGGADGGGGQGGQGGAAQACGDGLIATTESCDDGNTVDGDGCDSTCSFETPGWDCVGAPTVCVPKCGDGFVVGKEACDDGNTKKSDGCSDTCTVDNGYACTGAPSACTTVCGDGILAGAEQCDDHNTTALDGCSGTCEVETGWTCVSQPSQCLTSCGDGVLAGAEECDDHNFMPGDGCSDSCQIEPFYACAGAPSGCVTPCGDGHVVGTEQCDDGNLLDGDGCNAACKPEPGYACSGAPSKCVTVCGDGVRSGTEACDDGNVVNGDGCNAVCKVEPGFTCAGNAPTLCTTKCGDGYAAGSETCDDGNIVNGDGCDSACHAEHGYSCNNFPSVCETICGDGLIAGSEQCDDGNNLGGDGCSPTCGKVQGYTCTGEPSVCVPTCGDGIVAGNEQCDDGNLVNGDCCSSTCAAEAGCEIEPNDTLSTANVFNALAISSTVKGTIKPVADRDVYSVTVPAGKTAVITATTLDGYNSTCASQALDSYITIYDADGSTLLAADGGGTGKCALAQVANLQGGDYFVEVKSGAATIFSYAVNIQVQITVCGNGVKEPGEQCDDGNTVNGDGCSGLCTIEVVTEIEPNNNPAQALTNGAFPVNQLWAGAISPLGDNDYYLLHLNSTADLRIQTFDSSGPGSCVAIDTVIYLYAANGTTLLASNDDGGISPCSLIDSTSSTFAGARHLAPGNYYVRVQRYLDNLVINAYDVLVTYNALCGNGIVEGSEQCDGTGGPPCDATCNRVPICGDGFLDPPEICDDGNTTSGDGCSSTCQIEGVQNEVEPNNTVAQADASPLQLTGSALLVASIGSVGDKDVFKVTVATTSVVRFETFQSTYDCGAAAMTLRLLDSGGVGLKVDTPSLDTTASGIKSCAALVVALTPGTYYIQVEQTGNSAAIPLYYLQMKLETDLGNEVEPNNLIAQATTTNGVDFYIYGDHQAAADIDYYAISVPAGASIRAEIVESAATPTCESNAIDSYLTLYSPSASSLVTDDDDGRGYCSAIDGTGATPRDSGAHNLAAGTYYLQVKASALASASASIFNYRLAVTVR